MKKILTVMLCVFVVLCSGCKFTKDKTAANINDTEHVPATIDEIAAKDYSSLSNNSIGWGFKKIKASPPDIPSATQELLEKYNAVYMDKNAEKTIYLTFDQGYEAGYTAKILDTLKKHDVPAAFFITGGYLKYSKDMVDRIVDEGHIVGNHSQTHPSLPKLAPEEIAEDMLALENDFKNYYGFNMKFDRPPKGEYSERTLSVLSDLGYRSVLWSFAYMDWDENRQKGVDYAYEQIMSYVHDGAILLLHSVSKDNADVLDRVITDLKAAGYRFGRIDEIE